MIPSKKSGTTRRQSVDNLSPDFVSRALKLLSLIQRGVITQKQLAKHSDLTVRQVRYDVLRLIEKGYLIDATKRSNKWKVYRVSVAGRSLLDGVRQGGKSLIKIMNENVRAKCEIHNIKNFMKMVESSVYDLKETSNWKNARQWHAKIEGHSVEFNVGTQKASMKIIAPRYHANTGAESGYVTISGILEVCKKLEEKWSIGLSFPIFYEGEFAMHTPYAEAVMQKTGGREVKFGDFKINQSPPYFIPHEEYQKKIGKELDFDKHLEVPRKMDELLSSVGNLNQQFMDNTSNQNDINEKVANLLEGLTKATTNNSTKIDSLTDNIAKLVTGLSKLTEPVQQTNKASEVTNGDKPVNSDISRMFG